MNKLFTVRQTEEILAFKHDEFKRINLWDGSVRSGKTWITCIIFALQVAKAPKDAPILMVGKSITALKRNVLDVLVGLVGDNNMWYSTGAKEARLFGRKIFLEGANDARSEGKIRGLTLWLAYCDELSLYPEDFFAMLLSRLSMPGAMLMATTNPDNPGHWLKKNYIDRMDDADPDKRVDMRLSHFLLDDNTTLPPGYVANLKREHTGVFYERFIRGLWVAAEGAIYPMFDKNKHVVSLLPKNENGNLLMRRHYIAVDYGHTNATVFLHIGEGYNHNAYVMREWVHNGGEKGAMSPKGYSSAMRAFIGAMPEELKNVMFEGIYIDPSAEGFIAQLREDTNYRIRGADNAVLSGIMLVSSMLDAKMLKVHESCKETISELHGYVWDEKAKKLGEDRPVKKDDHCVDALRYGIMADKNYWKRRVANGTA